MAADGGKVGTAYVELEARTNKLEADLARAQSQINAFAAQAERGSAVASGGFATLGTSIKRTIAPITQLVGAVGGAIGLFQLFVSLGERIGKMLFGVKDGADAAAAALDGLTGDTERALKALFETDFQKFASKYTAPFDAIIDKANAALDDPEVKGDDRARIEEERTRALRARGIAAAKAQQDFADEQRDKSDAERAKREADAADEQAARTRRFMEESASLDEEFMDERTKVAARSQRKADELRAQGFEVLAQQEERQAKQRLGYIDLEASVRSALAQRAAQEEERREAEATQRRLLDERRIAAEAVSGLRAASGASSAAALLARIERNTARR